LRVWVAGMGCGYGSWVLHAGCPVRERRWHPTSRLRVRHRYARVHAMGWRWRAALERSRAPRIARDEAPMAARAPVHRAPAMPALRGHVHQGLHGCMGSSVHGVRCAWGPLGMGSAGTPGPRARGSLAPGCRRLLGHRGPLAQTGLLSLRGRSGGGVECVDVCSARGLMGAARRPPERRQQAILPRGRAGCLAACRGPTLANPCDSSSLAHRAPGRAHRPPAW
jgi:hypothetical protein